MGDISDYYIEEFYKDLWARGDEMGELADEQVERMLCGKAPVGYVPRSPKSGGRTIPRNLVEGIERDGGRIPLDVLMVVHEDQGREQMRMRTNPATSVCIRHGYWYANGEQVRKATLAEEARYGVTGRGEVVFTDEPVALKKFKQYNPKESVNMNKVTVNGQLQTYVAVVNFINGHNTYKDYDFLCNIPLAQDDVVVVDSSNGLGLARVVGIKTASRAATNWVVDRVDLDAHNARIHAETRRKELEKEMEARMRKLDKLAKYRMMAENDPTMKAMLEELEALENGGNPSLPASEGSDNE